MVPAPAWQITTVHSGNSSEYDVYPLTTVLAGLTLYPASSAAEVLRFFREFVSTAPDELTCIAIFLTAPPAPFVPAELQMKPAIAVAVCYADDLEEGQRVLQPLRSFGQPAADLIGPMSYPVLQSMFDEGAPKGMQNYWKSAFLNHLSDGAIGVLVEAAAAMRSPLAALHIHHMQGVLSRVSAEATAFGNRDAHFVLNIVGLWPDPTDSPANIAWVRDTYGAISSYATGRSYVNFMADEGQDRVRAAYSQTNFDRLVALKRKYDPTNLFRLNQNIRPD